MTETILRENLDRVDFSDVDSGDAIPRTRPGDMLRLEFMEPMGLSAYALARAMGVPANRVTGILHGTRAITADTAIRLGRHFGTTAEMWMNLQTSHDLAMAREALAAA